MRFASFSLLLSVSLAALGDSSRILGVFPSPGYSQFILAERLMVGLADRGHHVTVISPFKPKRVARNYRSVVVDGMLEHFGAANLFHIREKNVFTALYEMYVDIGFSMTEYILSEPQVRSLINSKNETFDLIIVELFVNEAHVAFAHHFDAPLVLFSSIAASEWVNFFVANPSAPSYISHSASGYAGEMNLWERLRNLFVYVYDVFLREFYLYPKHELFVKKYFPKAPNLKDVLYNASLVLLNSHPSYTESVPLVPSMIEIGGFHIRDEPLEDELKTFLDDSEEGVVYFSMGSNLKSKDLTEDYKEVLMDVFKKLSVKVLWKFEEENLPNKPENLKISKWLPQRAVLGHPNVKGFISHCGHISVTEAAHFGVPLICVPIYGDQPMNAARVSKNGMGIILEYEKITRETLTGALDAILKNKSYHKKAKEISSVMNDRVVKPMDLATYWIEYVIRNRGVQHLRSTGLNLWWYQYLYLDALSIIVAGFVVVYLIVLRIFKQKVKKDVKKVKHH